MDKMEILKFRVVVYKPIDKNFSLQEMQQIKVHEDYLIEENEIKLAYKYKPTSLFNVENFIELMLKFLKKKYKTTDVTLTE